MNKTLEIFLGILTAMGGFVEIGELVFCVNAGAKFRYSLLWVVALGTVGIIVYGEMAGRIAAVAKQPIFTLIRHRTGYATGLVTLLAANAASLLTTAAEIGGIAILLKLLFGGNYFLLVICTFAMLMLVVWFLSFHAIERIFGLLGLLMVVFGAAAYYLTPNWTEIAAGFVPQLPIVDTSKEYFVYAYFGVALMSSIMLPYETYFYAAGAIEDKWDPGYVNLNRVIVIIGFTLGSLLAVSLLLVGASFFGPMQIEPQMPGTAALASAAVFGKWGLVIALLGMFFALSGAAIENSLSCAYNLMHFLGWPWGKFLPPKDAPRFHLSWMVTFVIAAMIILTGVDPVQVVEYSIVFSVVILPLTFYPTLMAARDKAYMGEYANKWFANVLGLFYLVLISVAALAAIPLLIYTNGGKG